MIIIIDFVLYKFSWEFLLFKGYTHSTSEPLALPLRVTAVGKVIRITRLPLRVTVVGRSLLKNGSWLSATDKQKNKKEKEP